MSTSNPTIRSAFTLIETLIAAAITVVVLGSAITAHRVVQASTVRAEEQAQMRALAFQSIDELRLMRDSLSTSSDFGSQLGLNASIPTDTGPVYGTVVASKLSGNCLSGGSSPQPCPSPESGGPISLSWCGSSCAANTIISQLLVPSCQSGSCYLSDIISYVQGLPSNLSGGHPGELVAVRHDAYGNVGSNRDYNAAVIGADNPLPDADNSYWVKVDDPNSTTYADWNIYIRQIAITRYGTTGSFAYIGPSVATMSNATYRVTVTITDLKDPGKTISETALVTDWRQ